MFQISTAHLILSRLNPSAEFSLAVPVPVPVLDLAHTTLQLCTCVVEQLRTNCMTFRLESTKHTRSLTNSSETEPFVKGAGSTLPLILIEDIAPRHAGDLPLGDIKICANHKQLISSYVICLPHKHLSSIEKKTSGFCHVRLFSLTFVCIRLTDLLVGTYGQYDHVCFFLRFFFLFSFIFIFLRFDIQGRPERAGVRPDGWEMNEWRSFWGGNGERN